MRLAPYTRISTLLFFFFATISSMAADDKDLSIPADGEAEPFIELSRSRADQPDTVFWDIKMSFEQVIARDTFGNWWQYDFRSSEFIPYQPPERSESARPEAVEVRCIERKAIRFVDGDVLVGYEEFVDGNVFTLGNVTVSGWVTGKVRSLNGEVVVTRSGQVDGTIKAPRVTIRPGGVVSGTTTLTQPWDLPVAALVDNGLLIAITGSVLFLFIGFLLISLMSRQVGAITECVRRYRLRSFFIGLLSLLILLPIVLGLLVVSIVGIVLLPFVPVVCIVAIGMGIVSFGNLFGDVLLRRKTSIGPPAMLPSLFGIAVLSGIWILAVWLAGSSTTLLQALGTTFLLVVALYTAYPVLTGLGAAVLTRGGFRTYVSLHDAGREEIDAPAPAPPPLPKSPPVIRPSPGPVPKASRPDRSTPPPLQSGGE